MDWPDKIYGLMHSLYWSGFYKSIYGVHPKLEKLIVGSGTSLKRKDWLKPKKLALSSFSEATICWEQTFNTHFDIFIDLLPRRLLASLLSMEGDPETVHPVWLTKEDHDLGLDPHTIQPDSIVASDKELCFLEMKTKNSTKLTVQQILKYVFAAAVAGNGRSRHRLLLVTKLPLASQWKSGERQEIFGSGGTAEQLNNFLRSEARAGKLDNWVGQSGATRRLLNNHGEPIAKELEVIEFEALQWSDFATRLNEVLSAVEDGDFRAMLFRLSSGLLSEMKRLQLID